MGNWQNFTARLPISRWDELKKLQISIQGIPTMLNPVPPVYLAGMFVEVNYEIPPLLGGESEIVEETTDDLPVLSAPNAVRVLRSRGGSNVFGAGEKVEFDLDLGEFPASGTLPDAAGTPPENVIHPEPAPGTSTTATDLPPPEDLPSTELQRTATSTDGPAPTEELPTP